MKNNCQSCCERDGETVRELLHTKLGSTHILSLEEKVAGAVPAMFKATADYAVEDSFLVNGEVYTPVTQDGTALRTQFFKAGGVVNVAVDTVTKRLGFPIGAAGTGKVPVEAAGKLLMGDEEGNIVSSGKTADEVGAVKSVFGRTGEVTARAGDYTAAMVGAAERGEGGAALNALALGDVPAASFPIEESGRWVPTLENIPPNYLSDAVGEYVRYGKLVFVRAQISFREAPTDKTIKLLLSGFPYPNSGISNFPNGSLYARKIINLPSPALILVEFNDKTVSLRSQMQAGIGYTMLDSSIITNETQFLVAMEYLTL